MLIVSVALPVPLRRSFDYLSPEPLVPPIGGRIKVPFGNKQLIGVVLEHKSESDFPVDKLKPLLESLDQEPVLPASLLALLRWSAAYYQHGIGDVMCQALPVLLRKGEPAELRGHQKWQLTDAGQNQDLNALKRAPKQQQALALLKEAPRSSAEPTWRHAVARRRVSCSSR